MRSLLTGLTAADIRHEPFAHVVVPDALDPAFYAELSAGFPSVDRIVAATITRRMPSNRRYALPAHMVLESDDLPDCWKRFAGLHSDPAFFAEVADLFRDHWPPELLAAAGGRLTGHAMGRLRLFDLPPAEPLHIAQDARLEVNTPVRDRASVVRGPHLDTPNRLYSGLFYLRAPEDDSEGGELLLYRWRRGPVGDIAAYELPPDAVEEVVRIPYRANQLVLFPQNVHALHGVGARGPTPHARRYVFITAEMNRDWLTAPAGGIAA